MFHTTFVQIGESDWLLEAVKRVNFLKKIKIFFLETIRGMKPKLGIHAQDTNLYISFFFFFIPVG